MQSFSSGHRRQVAAAAALARPSYADENDQHPRILPAIEPGPSEILRGPRYLGAPCFEGFQNVFMYPRF